MKNTSKKSKKRLSLDDVGGPLTDHWDEPEYFYDLHRLIDYCKKNNIDIEKMTEEEKKPFLLKIRH